ncbi:diiron oxygenase [Rhodococcus sp. NPDC058514]|uniref:AurF N-oxygenase family protein n=1 Tax=unclassified Rhodococcus (in: high G+C Gram-positive bacteria) TaxID=192944 RepID=UPI00364DCFE5
MTGPFELYGGAGGFDGLLSPPMLPDCDESDPVESAVIRGLVRSWPARATVRRAEPDLDDLFDPSKADFSEDLIPFREHDLYRCLDETKKARLRAWGWIAYNKNVMDVEQFVVNPGFQLLSRDAFGTGLGDRHRAAAVQSMVDEEYHTLMHLNASALTRSRRGWPLREDELPPSQTVRRHHSEVSRHTDPRAAALTTLAFTTVAETSISSYLGLMTEDESVQPVNRATVALHRRDELCHSSITGDLVTLVYDRLDADDRRTLLEGLSAGVDAFTANDMRTWLAILEHEQVTGAGTIIADATADSVAKPMVQDCSAIRRLCEKLGVAKEIRDDW